MDAHLAEMKFIASQYRSGAKESRATLCSRKPLHAPPRPQDFSLTQEVFFCHSCRDFMALQIQPSILWLKVLTSSARFQADVYAGRV